MSEWTLSTLRALIGQPISGSRPTGGVTTETEGIPSLGGENVRTDGRLSFRNLNRVSLSFYESMPKGRLQPLDVLINKDGAQTGKVGLYKGEFQEACVNEHLYILRCRNGAIDQRLLFYSLLLPTTQTKIARRITGSAQPGLNAKFVDAVDVLIPSDLVAQRGIADILSTMDEAIKQTEALIAKYQDIHAGLMHDLLTRGVAPNGKLAKHLRKKKSLGWLPKAWELVPLESIRVSNSPITYGVLKPGPYVEDGIPLLQIEDILGDEIDLNRIHRISLNLDAQYMRTRVFGGEIVISLVGTIGRIARLPDNLGHSNLHRNLGVIRVSESHNPDFIAYLLASQLSQKQIRETTMGTTQSLLNLKALRQLLIPCPLRPEQDRIAELLTTSRKQVKAEEVHRSKLVALKNGLMSDLLTGRVPVKT